jgi:hypothetical protein
MQLFQCGSSSSCVATTDAMIAGVRVLVVAYDTPGNVIEL